MPSSQNSPPTTVSRNNHYFENNQGLRVEGDIYFISNSGSSQDNANFAQITQRARTPNGQAREMERGASLTDSMNMQSVPKSTDLGVSHHAGFEILQKNTAPSALYGFGHSFEGPQCHPGTRVAIQDSVFRWLDDPDGTIAMWMNGPVGIGKSAIAQTVAHRAKTQDQLSSAFFFFRSDGTRNSTKHLVPTLAYEMTQQMPSTRNSVCQAIATNPFIFSAPLDNQINDILLQPLHRIEESSSESLRLVIIDGLDECLDSDTQQRIIRSFISCFLSASTRIIPPKLLIVSRPESKIASAFSAASVEAHVTHLSLNSWSTWDDVEIFLNDKLKEIRDTHPMKHHLPSVWPDKDSLRTLLQRSVGSFAYASTVIRYLESHNHNPERALQDILSFHPPGSSAAFADLDALYRHILSSLDPNIYYTVQNVLCLHLYSDQRSLSVLAPVLLEDRSAVEIALLHVSSLISSAYDNIRFHHSSFEEFLRDRERSREHYVFSATTCSAAALGLSKLWMYPEPVPYKSLWFQTMFEGFRRCGGVIYMDHHVVCALAATEISASFLTIEQSYQLEYLEKVCEFFLTIRMISRRASEDYKPEYREAFEVVCMWLRSRLDVLFDGPATLSDILSIILDSEFFRSGFEIEVQRDPGLSIFLYLARAWCDPIDLLCQLFPEMAYADICCRIVEVYLALPSSSRRADVYRQGPNFYESAHRRLVTLTELYASILLLSDTMPPSICQQLEQLVLDGQQALGTTPSRGGGGKHYIFRILYGEPCHFDGQGQLHVLSNNDGFNSEVWKDLVEKTDRYISLVHNKLDLQYISAEVEAVYRW